jgi:ribose transport system substrate-binding protein
MFQPLSPTPNTGRRFMVFVVLCLLALGCTQQSERAAAPEGAARSGSQGTIGVSLLTLTNPFFQVIGDHLTEEAARHGYRATVLSADEDVNKQGNQVKDFIVSGVAAIVLSPCQVEAIGPIIREANKAGIPVFTVDIPCNLPDVKIACQVASDNYGGGRQAAEGMIEALGGNGGKVAVLHYAQAESCQLRVQGFQDKIHEHNASGAPPVEIVAVLEGGGAKDRGAKATEDLLQSTPDIAGIFAINDPSALGALAALERAGKAERVVLIGFDGQPDGKRAIREGKIYGDPVQFPDKMGVEVVRAIVKHSQGEELPAEMLIPTSFYRQPDALQDPKLR